MLLWFYIHLYTYTNSQYPAPSVGDVRLVNYNCYEDSVNGTVEIYYDDGVHGPQWGYMCESYALKFTAEVVCRQLGYSDGNLNQHEAHSQENEGQILRQTTTNRVQVGRHIDMIDYVTWWHFSTSLVGDTHTVYRFTTIDE